MWAERVGLFNLLQRAMQSRKHTGQPNKHKIRNQKKKKKGKCSHTESLERPQLKVSLQPPKATSQTRQEHTSLRTMRRTWTVPSTPIPSAKGATTQLKQERQSNIMTMGECEADGGGKVKAAIIRSGKEEEERRRRKGRRKRNCESENNKSGVEVNAPVLRRQSRDMLCFFFCFFASVCCAVV